MFSMPYGDVWRQRRRLTHTALNTEIVKRYEEMQARHMKDLIESLIDCPQDFMEAIHL
jgi:cytochrome P450